MKKRMAGQNALVITGLLLSALVVVVFVVIFVATLTTRHKGRPAARDADERSAFLKSCLRNPARAQCRDFCADLKDKDPLAACSTYCALPSVDYVLSGYCTTQPGWQRRAIEALAGKWSENHILGRT